MKIRLKLIVVIASMVFAAGFIKRISIIRTINPENRMNDTGNFFNKELFLTSINQVKAVDGEYMDKISGAVIPHHLIAGYIIADIFQNLKSQNPVTVVLIGPNHNEVGNSILVTGYNDWNTYFGEVITDRKLVGFLVENGFGVANDDILTKDQSVSGVIPYVAYYIPETRIVSVLLSHRISIEEIERLASFLSLNLGKGDVVIASVDFSHGLDNNTSKIKDDQTTSALKSKNYKLLLSLNDENLDSATALVLLDIIMDKEGNKNFKILHHTNSGVLSGDISSQVTSYFGLAY